MKEIVGPGLLVDGEPSKDKGVKEVENEYSELLSEEKAATNQCHQERRVIKCEKKTVSKGWLQMNV
jgi:hypothetical protein